MPVRPLPARLAAAGFAAALGWALTIYPLRGNCLLPILIVSGSLIWWRTDLWLLLLPALLPILDLAPRTGWFFLEEIDLLLLLTAALTYWRLPSEIGDAPGWPPLFRAGLILTALAVGVGLWRGLQPLPVLDANTFNNYLSGANALRVGKAWLWALILLPPLRRTAGPQLHGLRRYLLPGMLAGLLLVSAAAIQERMQFTGLLNFSSNYRITAPFSAMHTGGAALDGYLALSTPLLAIWLFDRHSPARSLAALALLPLAWYAGLATFSRGLYLALAAAVVLVAAQALRRRPLLIVLAGGLILMALEIAFRAGGYRAWAAALLLIVPLAIALARGAAAPALAGLLVLSAAVPIAHGYYVGVRFNTVNNDWDDRVRHWRQTLGLMGDSTFLGMGLGTFPARYYWNNPQREVPPSYQFIDEGANRHLRLSAGEYTKGYGELLRIWQAVDLLPQHSYQLAADVWNDGPPAFLHLNLCQRQLLYPQNCIAVPLRQIPAATYQQRYTFTVDSGVLGSDGVPVKLEIAAEGQGAVLNIDNLSLRSLPEHHELLRNGGFSDANNYWFFSSDRNHLPWHVKNLALNLYFEMGWLGLSAYALLLSSALAAKRREAAWLAALIGFQIVGLFDSLLDVPRITLLSTLLLAAAALQPKESS